MNETTNKKNSTAKEPDLKQQEIDELKKKIEALTQIMLAQQASSSIQEQKEDKEINPNAKTKVTSLTYGTLSLYHPARGFLKFDNYGATHTITFAQLSDYMTTCRGSAEKGMFYIHNQQMVEELSLSEVYEHILSYETLKKILDSKADYKSIIEKTTPEQKETIVDILTQKVYSGEFSDLNKIRDISDIVGVNIMSKVESMVSLDKNKN